MSRTLLTLALLLVACKDAERKPGPALTPVIANQLRALAGNCEIRPAKGEHGAKELRVCEGRQATMTIHLDEHRNLLHLEIGVWAALGAEAQQLLEQTVRGIISDKARAAMVERLGNAKSDPVVVDGVRVNAFRTQAAKENPRYTVDLAW
ncbi:MAG TPA: hypothetical protein VK427_11600 [Kofleriaceae bacterium]|nr:hypothetical protein [Kofleriaceae bacterium]